MPDRAALDVVRLARIKRVSLYILWVVVKAVLLMPLSSARMSIMMTRFAGWGRVRLLVERVESDSHRISVSRFAAVVLLVFCDGALLVIILIIVLFLVRRAVSELVDQASQLRVNIITVCQAGEVR